MYHEGKEFSFLYKKTLVKSTFSRTRLQGLKRKQRRESNKRRVNAMMRRNLFISKLQPLSFSAEGTLVDGWSKLSLARTRSAFQKLLSATSRRYFVKSNVSINDTRVSSETARPLFPVLSSSRCFATWYTTSLGTCTSRCKEYIPPGIRNRSYPRED